MSDQPSPAARALVFTIQRLGLPDVIESATPAAPCIITPGEPTILPYIEEQMEHAADYEVRTFVVPCAHAFGAYQNVTAWFSRTAFAAGIELRPGLALQAERPDGSLQPMFVLEIRGSRVHCSLNHWLAGQDLHFTGHFIPMPGTAIPRVTPALFSPTPPIAKFRN